MNPEIDCPSGLSSAALPVRVLHIEDDLGVARAFARLLRLKGYEVRSGATRREVLSHFNINGWRPDIIVADYQLASGTTSESLVAEVASRVGSRLPTIVLAGTMAPQGRRACEAFADRVLYKPVDLEVLLREFEALLNRKV